MIRLVLLLCLMTQAAWADPALFVARGPRATVYLLGSMHMLAPDTAWQGPAIRRAMAAATEVWFENVEPDDPAALMPSVTRLGMTDRPLSALLTPSVADRLDAAAQKAGLAGSAALERMRPWLAMTVVAVASLKQAGLDPALGVDQVLTRQARAAGKPVRGLETAEQSLAALAGLSDAAALRLLTELIDGRAAETASAMVTPWLAGDLAALGEGMTAKMQREEPEVFRALMVERSARWAEQVAALLEGDGAKLVVVGAGHLAGPENMIDMLASRGIRFDRVPSP